MKAAFRFLFVPGAVTLALGLATGAHADNDDRCGGGGGGGRTGAASVQSVSPMSLGTVVSASSGITVFRVDPQTGGVSVVSGSGARSPGGDARALVTIACGSDSRCARDQVRIRVGSINLETGRGQRLSNFTVQMNSAVLAPGSVPIAGDPVDFTIAPIGRYASKTFYVAADAPILGDDASASPFSSALFYVYAGYAPSVPLSGSNAGVALAQVTRALTLSASGTLSFGRLVRPASGVGTAVVDPDQGAYHNTNVVALPTPGPSRVVFTATGAPNKTISVSIPHDFTITAPSGAKLDVTVSSNAGGSETLNGGGSYSFGVGGSINLSNTTPTGVYRGSFTVTVAYD